MTFKLFFSEIFIDKASIYSALQFLHPLFYTSKENLIQLIQYYKFRFPDHYKNFDLNETIYGVYNWIDKIQILDESDLTDVFNHDPNYYFAITSKDGKTGHGHTLPYFVRNLYQHYRKKVYFLSFMLLLMIISHYNNIIIIIIIIITGNRF